MLTSRRRPPHTATPGIEDGPALVVADMQVKGVPSPAAAQDTTHSMIWSVARQGRVPAQTFMRLPSGSKSGPATTVASTRLRAMST